MTNNRDGNGDGTRKRKGKGIVIEEPQQPPQQPPQPPPQQFQLPSPPPLPLPPAIRNNTPLITYSSGPQQPQNIFSYRPPPPPNVGPSSSSSSRSRVRQILNAAAPVRPFSFMSLITAPYNQVEPHFQNFFDQAEIDQIVKHHAENLKQALKGALEKQQISAEDRAAKKLKDKEVELQVKCSQVAELESVIELYKQDASEAQYRIMSLQHEVRSLRTDLDNLMNSMVHSSEEEIDEANTVQLNCKICETEMANVVVWPCRHICLCVACDVTTGQCPVCGENKTSSVKVFFPDDDD